MSAEGVQQSFVEAVLAGDATPDDVDDFVDAWHASAENIGLAEFLGMTDEEYARWVENPEGLRAVLHSRKNGTPGERRGAHGHGR